MKRSGLRARFEAIVRSAEDAGMEDARSLMSLTLTEAEGRLRAFTAARRERIRELDALAWLIGRYTALAVLAPSRYPDRPCGEGGRVHGAEAMKRVFERMAKEEEDA